MEERRILDSWKEISAYLNRSVMTCHRWEENLGLPIHRLDGTPKARVFAYADELDRWLAEKLHTAEAADNGVRPAERTKRKWVLAAAVSVAVLAAVAGRYLYFGPLPAPSQVPSLAVLSFENRTGDPVWDAWQTALPDLLMLDLRQSKFLDVIRTSELLGWPGVPDLIEKENPAEAVKFSAADLRKIAARADVGYLLTGSIDRSGQGIVVTALLHHGRTGDVAFSSRTTIDAEKGIFLGADDLSKKVKAGLNVTPRQVRGDIDRPAAKITTRSPEAFKLFSQAYRVQGKLKFEGAISPLQKAVEIDPEFGLAYRLLFHVCRAVSRPEEAMRFGETAVRLADRIAERERYKFLQDYFSSALNDKRRGLEAYLRLAENYPYDQPMFGLAQFYMGREEWDEALPVLQRLILRYPRKTWAVLPLSACYRCLGRYGQADAVIDSFLGSDPPSDRDVAEALAEKMVLASSQGEFDIAHDCVERIKVLRPDSSWYLKRKGWIYFMQDDLPNAERAYAQLLEMENKRVRLNGLRGLASVSLSRGNVGEAKEWTRRAIELTKGLGKNGPAMEQPDHLFLAYLERLSGRMPEAMAEAELACRAPDGQEGLWLASALYLRALITLEIGRSEEFEKQLAEIKGYLAPDRFPGGAPRFMRIYHNLLGHRELRRGNLELAISYYWKALDLLSPLAALGVDADHTKYYFDLAEAYRLSGGAVNARAMYEKVLVPTIKGAFSGDLYARSYYWLGLDQERWMRSGNPDLVQERRLKAIGYYRKFLDLWKDADPMFTEVADARQRLARLEAE